MTLPLCLLWPASLVYTFLTVLKAFFWAAPGWSPFTPDLCLPCFSPVSRHQQESTRTNSRYACCPQDQTTIDRELTCESPRVLQMVRGVIQEIPVAFYSGYLYRATFWKISGQSPEANHAISIRHRQMYSAWLCWALETQAHTELTAIMSVLPKQTHARLSLPNLQTALMVRTG